jgi:hypothetical protein
VVVEERPGEEIAEIDIRHLCKGISAEIRSFIDFFIRPAALTCYESPAPTKDRPVATHEIMELTAQDVGMGCKNDDRPEA